MVMFDSLNRRMLPALSSTAEKYAHFHRSALARIFNHNFDRGVTVQDPMVCESRSEQSVRDALQEQTITTWIDREA